MPQPGPTVRPTGPTALAVAAVVGGGLTWIVLSIADNLGWVLPTVPVLAAVVVAVLALITWLAARWTHRTVQTQQPIEPTRAVGLVLAGKAALLGGTALASGYAVLVLRQLPNVDATLPRERVLVAGAVTVLSIGLAVAGWALERACQVPPENDSDDAPTSQPGVAHRPG